MSQKTWITPFTATVYNNLILLEFEACFFTKVTWRSFVVPWTLVWLKIEQRGLKLNETISWEKLFVWKLLGAERGWKCSPNEVFKFFEKSVHGTFLIFCMKLQHHNGLNLTQIIFLDKNLALDFLDKKWPKMSFLSFTKSWCIEFFWFFTRSYNSMKNGNWIKQVLTKLLFWDF